MPDLIHRIKIIHGRLQYEDEDKFYRNLLTLKHDWPYELIIRSIRKKRTDKQNRYYWGVVIDYIARQMGESDKDEVHKTLAMHFLGYEEQTYGGVSFQSTRSTTSLSTEEMTEYIETVRRWAAEFLALNIPDPDQVDFL
jgi:hypothetical protein